MTALSTDASPIVDHDEALKSLSRLRRAARKVLQARKAQDDAKSVVDKMRPGMVEQFHALGLSEIEAVPGEGIQLVEPIKRVFDEENIKAAMNRHRPEFMELVFPTRPVFDAERFRSLLDEGALPQSWERFVEDKTQTPQLRRINMRGKR